MEKMSIRHILILLLAPLQFLTSRWHELTGVGRSVGDMAVDAPLFVTPAGYAFLIWILIFALQTIYAGWQIRASERDSVVHSLIGWPMVIALAASNLWMLAAIYLGNGWILLSLITIMFVATLTAFLRVVSYYAVNANLKLKGVIIPMLGICSGWLSLAWFLNFAGTLQIGLSIQTGTVGAGLAILLGASLLALIMMSKLNSQSLSIQSYGCAVVWGLIGITMANTIPQLSPVGLASGVVAIAAWIAAMVMVIAMWVKTKNN
jgi:hypothetical protein